MAQFLQKTLQKSGGEFNRLSGTLRIYEATYCTQAQAAASWFLSNNNRGGSKEGGAERQLGPFHFATAPPPPPPPCHPIVDQNVDVEKLIRAKYQDNLEFMQWFKRFYELNYNGAEEDYDPVAHRQMSKGKEEEEEEEFKP